MASAQAHDFRAGFDLSTDFARLKPLDTGSPSVRKDDMFAAQAWAILLHLLKSRLASMAFHTEGYPGRCALLLSEEASDQAEFCSRFSQDWDAFQSAKALAKQTGFMATFVKPSPFQCTWVKKLVALFLGPDSPARETL